MYADENKATICSLYKASAAKDVDKTLSFFADDAVLIGTVYISRQGRDKKVIDRTGRTGPKLTIW